tara:strand:+ start:169 stop:1095 length:927 start_codon:yes stop_codon:yes gene_type:complete
MKKISTLIILIFFLSSCSRIITGSRQSMNITSTPSGADVYIMGHKRGKTPLKVKVYKQKPPVSVVVKKDGYKTEEMYSKKRFNPVYLGTIMMPFYLFFDRSFYLKKNYEFSLSKGEDQYFTRKKINLDEVEGDYIIKCTGEIIPCIIKSYRRRKTVYIDKSGDEKEIESFELSILKFGDKRFELGPNISKYKGEKSGRIDNPYDIKILLEYGEISLYGLRAKISLNTDKKGKRSISYLVSEGTSSVMIETTPNIIKVNGAFYNITSENITNLVSPSMLKNKTFVKKNNGDNIDQVNLREKIKLYNSCF